MSWNFSKLLREFSQKNNSALFYDTRHGLERETLRISSDGSLSQTPHPQNLGAPLTNPFISTDFSESQLELVTPPVSREEQAVRFLEEIHVFLYQKNKNDLLWPASMPCRLPAEDEIPLARYGKSQIARKKTIYRRALGYRYRRKMQTIAGVHYNFSFGEKFWNFMYKKYAAKNQNIQDFVSDVYLRISRNFLQLVWMDTYLFGASPALDKTYMEKRKRPLKKLGKDTYYGKYATSVRMSRFGYCCKAQSLLKISYNDLNSYVNGLKNALVTPYKKYTKIGLEKNGEQIQLNDNILQIPNEYYAAIRPKRSIELDGDVLDALEQKGIEYIEVRSVDIDPFEPSGVSNEHLLFLHTLMVYCMMKESKNICKNTYPQILQNTDKVALYGRKPGLKLIRDDKKVRMREWGVEVLEEMLEVAALIDKNFKDTRHSDAIEKQIQKFIDPTLTPSAKILTQLRKDNISFLEFGLQQAQKNAVHLRKRKLNPLRKKQLENAVTTSLRRLGEIEVWEEMFVKGYEDMELSTQIVIREALKRGIKVDVISRKNNLILLSRGDKREYLKEATMTGLDPLISYFLTGDKQATKLILGGHGINVPQGKVFQDQQSALAAYPEFSKGKFVIKPTDTNFGIGINFTRSGDKKSYENHIKEAFKFGDEVIVEEFVEGKEFRLLVFGDRVVGITQRIPANVLGDGQHSIKELVKIKNETPTSYKIPKYHIRIGKTEKNELKKQKLTINSIPPKGKQIFLRENTNVSTGGDPIDMTDEVHESYKKIAVQASKAALAEICGVDMFIKDPTLPAIARNYSIIELNFNPSLMIHTFPYQGRSREVGKALLDLLGF